MASHERDTEHTTPKIEERILGTLVGWVAGPGRQGTVKVDFEGNRHGLLEARLVTAVDEAALRQAIEQRQGAVLCFERGDPSWPIVLGLLQTESKTPLLDELLQPLGSEAAETQEPELIANGRRLSLAGLLGGATDQLEFRCGKASLILRRNGQVLLRGDNVLVDAGQMLRLRGGKTQIN
ncbi:DUF6484 domain-containing protein [Cystobacter ferrugineus]|uniref:DUF6484 domain-containing protein n=1 Tax=Cystobacter ferrugineus TaxID=83449 RepID=A0A1L9B641_9BACT|nr:DUF6484 domain-containing protein [Cystobacter ferrugineus]OJH37739.1 hypothetical protein BON30_26495 [Cystobacter ferrugineus]